MKKLAKLREVPILALWQKRLTVAWKRVSWLYAVPEPLPATRLYWLSLGLVFGAVLLFCGYFVYYLLGHHMTYITNAEDLGIMDQAIWNTLHGHPLRQTICNIISDTNCAGSAGVTRFAIHFEPILFPISLLYLFWPDPRTLLVVQTIVVGLGAFPAFWLARLRLRSEIAAIMVALLYLLYPVQQQAIVFDFHAVTLTASLLLFALYFMYTRRTVSLFICVLLALGCKEQIPLIVMLLGGWMLVFQQRWKLGLIFIFGAALWFVLAICVVMPHFSPTGRPMLIGRYEDVGQHPGAILGNLLHNPGGFLKQYLLNSEHRTYLRILLLPALYLPLLAPWTLFLASPSLLLNMFSSNKQMYSGLYQYNAEIVPILIFATIEGLLCARWLLQQVSGWIAGRSLRVQSVQANRGLFGRWCAFWFRPGMLVICLLGLTLFSTVRYDYRFHGQMPFSKEFYWPVVSFHNVLAERIIRKIPATASVSAQSHLVPHLSEREKIYLFPYGSNLADYVVLDLSSDVYPYFWPSDYRKSVKHLLAQGDYGIAEARDGYLLLQRGLAPPGPAYCPTMTPKNRARNGPDLSALLDEVCAEYRQTMMGDGLHAGKDGRPLQLPKVPHTGGRAGYSL
jgi:uncharacterized membrane protein